MSDTFPKGIVGCSKLVILNHSLSQDESNSSVEGRRIQFSITSSCEDDADSGEKIIDASSSTPPMLNPIQSGTQIPEHVEVGDTNDNFEVVAMADLEDGDAISTNSISNNDDAEEVVSNLRIQRVGVVGRSFKRRRIRD